MKCRLLIAGMAMVAVSAFAAEKKDLTERYKHKYVVVLRDGLAAGTCGAHSGNGMASYEQPTLTVTITGDTADFKPDTGFGAALIGCEDVVPEPLHKGEVLLIRYATFHKGALYLFANTVNPHQVTRGVGAHEHSSYEQASSRFKFMHCDPDGCQAAVEKWLKPFDTQEGAAKFGNTASGVYVKEVKLGMSFPEVEAALGPPITRVDLGEKVLYKYKDMTVEFKDGKVADVR